MRALISIGVALGALAFGLSSAGARTVHHAARPGTHALKKTSRHRSAAAHQAKTSSRARPAGAKVAASCGGTERWDVKDGSDAGAAHIDPRIVDGITIADLNQLSPQPIAADGRMQEEKVLYRITGVLRLFKHETDSDYHLVVADDPAAPYSTGHSIVVEIPDPKCVSGAQHQYGASQFLPQLQESQADFVAATRTLTPNRDLGSRNIPITIVGALFFDFMHGQTGHGLPHPSQDADRRDKVVELHPVLCNDVGGYREQAGKAAC
jgi:hypothetical protein